MAESTTEKSKPEGDYIAIPKTIVKTPFLVIGAIGLLFLFLNYRIERKDGTIMLIPRAKQQADSGQDQYAEDQQGVTPVTNRPNIAPVPPAKPGVVLPPEKRHAIRISSFDLKPFDYQKLDDKEVVERIIDQIVVCDIVAIQGIKSVNQSIMTALIQRINARGTRYNYACAPEIGREPLETYNVFVYKEKSIGIDRSTVSHVIDPEGKFTVLPLVASFITKAPAPEHAFTFTLVNVRVDSPSASEQIALLPTIYRAVRDDGRGEDDIILVGHVCDDRSQPSPLDSLDLNAAIAYQPTKVTGGDLLDNIMFEQQATVEFNGRTGVVPLLTIYRLSMAEARKICSSVPVWAEFSIFEGGEVGQMVDR